jgi:c-di-GMP-binding flagellar brake protein YcgR
MEELENSAEKRRYPRFLIDLPLEYRVLDTPYAHGGLVVNVSETGLLIECVKDMPIGSKLNITVLFPEGYELDSFEVSAEVVWRDIHWDDDNRKKYQYGLKFVSIKEQDHWKLRQLLFSRGDLDKPRAIFETTASLGQ